jgi:hypothetical protein
MKDSQQNIQLFGLGLFLFCLLSNGAYLICGIYLLKLKEPARKAVIFLGLISILSIPFFLQPIIKVANSDDYYMKKKQVIMQTMKLEDQQAALEKIKMVNERGKKIFPVIFIVFSGLLLVLEIIPIYFFTRQKVKDQFK